MFKLLSIFLVIFSSIYAAKNDEKITLLKKEIDKQEISALIKQGFLEDILYMNKNNNKLDNEELDLLKNWNKDKQNKINELKIDKLLTPNSITDNMKKILVKEAARVRTYGYAPYSKFHVGAAILTRSGKIYTGCNFENAAYGNTICAERAAVAKAISEENRGQSIIENKEIVAIAIVLRGQNGSPCGNCRQALYEFNPNMLIIMSDINGKNFVEKPLHQLLPIGFGPVCLDEAKIE